MAEKNCEDESNGSILSGKYIPFEVLLQIFIDLDLKTLLDCHLVCKYWCQAIKSCTWHEKAERALGKRIAGNKVWHFYYFVSERQPFDRNLVRNHSGAEGLEHWRCLARNYVRALDRPPNGLPQLPDDPVFEGGEHCFAVSNSGTSKIQEIDLVKEGFSRYVLDNIQPIIKVSEWFCGESTNRTLFACDVVLMDENRQPLDSGKDMYTKELKGEKTVKWHYYTDTYTNYGKGLRYIQFWDGARCIALAGASIKLLLPDLEGRENEKSDLSNLIDEFNDRL